VTFLSTLAADLEREHGFPPVRHKADALRPNPGWNAVGVTCWKTQRLELHDYYPQVTLWPDRIKPLERVGKSILLYYFPYPAENPAPTR
jgi:hypothetical protein